MTIKLDLTIFQTIYNWLWQHPYYVGAVWYIVAYFVVRRIMTYSKQDYEYRSSRGDMPPEIQSVLMLIFSPVLAALAIILFIPFVLGMGLVRIKDEPK